MSQLQSKLSAEKIPAEQWDQHLNYTVSSTSRHLPEVPVGAQACPVWVTWVKNIQNLSGTLFAFEIFEIAQKTKKLALMRYLLGSSQGCLGVPRHGPCGSVRSQKIFFEITIHIKSIIYLLNFEIAQKQQS